MSTAAKEKLDWFAGKNLNEVFKGETPKSFKDFVEYL
jgi:hypothetical protein